MGMLTGIVSESKVWRGAARILYAAVSQSFPGKLESIIQPAVPKDPHATAFALGTGWHDWGATSRDGVSITRSFEAEEGVETDQSPASLFGGQPSTWAASLAFTLMHTDPDSLALAWELPVKRSYALNSAGPDYKVAQTYSKFSAPSELTERRIAVIQEHPTSGKLRAFVFRKAALSAEASELLVARSNASSVPVSMVANPDTAVAEDQDMFGGVFDES